MSETPTAGSDEAAPTLQERFRAALPDATRWLPGALPRTPTEELRSIADEVALLPDPDEWDRYGARGAVGVLETRVAELLGKPGAAMFPSGIMAQQSVLRVWADRQASNRIAIPELSHLLRYETDGPQQLNQFRYERLTTGPTVPTTEHLDAIPGRLGAALLELPLRDAGFLLPGWDELEAFSHAARERGVPLHLDGARLWESQPYLGHSLAEIAALADSVYVSFYKGLGGLAGAVVAGSVDVVDEARSWRGRHGGTLFSMLPYALAGLRGLRTQLPRMREYYERAVVLAEVLEKRGFRIHPQPPHTNAFRVFADQAEDSVNERIVRSLEDDRTALLQPMRAGEMPGTCWAELTVGSGTMDWTVDEAADALATLLG
ncbi:MAG: beta-eliminating lyase-related protein [Nocardioidaceae bacterium]